MTDNPVSRPNTPWHLWAIGVVTLLWNSMGVVDYVMTMSQNEAYLSGFSSEQRAYFNSFPAYAMASWGIAVISALVGSALLLFRSRYAAHAFGLSLIAIAVTTIHNWVIDYANAMKMMSVFGLVFSLFIIAISIALYFYAKRQASKGMLR